MAMLGEGLECPHNPKVVDSNPAPAAKGLQLGGERPAYIARRPIIRRRRRMHGPETEPMRPGPLPFLAPGIRHLRLDDLHIGAMICAPPLQKSEIILESSTALKCPHQRDAGTIAQGGAVNKHAKPRENSGRKTARVALTVLLALCLVGIGALAAWHFLAPKADAGATVTSFDGMSDDEIRAELDRQVEASRMTISVAAKPQLKDGRVRVNVVNAQDSRFGQLFTLEQDGKALYKSGVVDPGKTVEWVDAEGAHAGEATVTVSAADAETGKATGNPQSVTVEIVE